MTYGKAASCSTNYNGKVTTFTSVKMTCICLVYDDVYEKRTKTLLKRAVLAYARHSPTNVRASSVEVSLL